MGRCIALYVERNRYNPQMPSVNRETPISLTELQKSRFLMNCTARAIHPGNNTVLQMQTALEISTPAVPIPLKTRLATRMQLKVCWGVGRSSGIIHAR